MSARIIRRAQSEAGFSLAELLVVMVLFGIIGGGVTSAVVSSMRVEQNQQQLQEVIGDGRISMERMRKELREVRRVFADSDGRSLRVWVDRAQDASMHPEELVCFLVEPLPTGDGSQYQLSRWTHAQDPSDCDPTDVQIPSESARQVMARTLTDPEVFTYSPQPGDVTDPPTREVSLNFVLEVLAPRGPGETTVEGTIRVRNVA